MEASRSEPQSSMHHVFLEDASLEEIETYYDELNLESSIRVEVDLAQPNQPYKGVYASARFEVGDEVFRESPLVAMQSTASAQTMRNCHECLGFIGESIDDQLKHFLEYWDGQGTVGNLEKGGDAAGVSCPGCEQVWYCGESCREASWKDHHSLMCPGSSHDGREWWDSFYEHAHNTNDIFILAGKVMSKVIVNAYNKIENLGMSPLEGLVDAWKPFKMGYKKKWWDSVALPSDVDPSKEDQFRADLKELAYDSFTLYSHAVELGYPKMYSKCRDFIHLDIWGSLIGMFELNNLSIIGPGPYSMFPCDEEHIKDILKSDDIVEEFMDAIVEGTGFYRMHSCMNHSCEPNCRAILPETNSEYNKAIIQAIKPIEPGAELTVSYIEEDEPYDVRQEQLRDYGFECLCSKCKSHR